MTYFYCLLLESSDCKLETDIWLKVDGAIGLVDVASKIYRKCSIKDPRMPSLAWTTGDICAEQKKLVLSDFN